MPGEYRVITDTEWYLGKIISARENKTSSRVTIFQIECESPEQATLVRKRVMSHARLDHENIARVLRISHDGAKVFVVTEYVDGEPISGMIRRGEQIEQYHAVRWLHDALDAVTFANSNLLRHGDVNADNIFITKDGVLKVVGFGFNESVGNDISNAMQVFRPLVGDDFVAKIDMNNPLRSVAVELHAIRSRNNDEVEEKLSRIEAASAGRSWFPAASRLRIKGRLSLALVLIVAVCGAILLSGSLFGRSARYQQIKSSAITLPESKPLEPAGASARGNGNKNEELVEDDTDFYLDKARMLEKIKDYEAAVKTLRQALVEKPGNKKLLTELERLSK